MKMPIRIPCALVFALASVASGQEIALHGVVTDAIGQPIAGASVAVRNTSQRPAARSKVALNRAGLYPLPDEDCSACSTTCFG
ncbi:hypothetical protein OAX78_02050 [Planctomycetota bacterium]|nr:hypothetical protein [Planctomycetota bacterium]